MLMAKRKGLGVGAGPNLLKYFRPEAGGRQEPGRTTSVGGELQCAESENDELSLEPSGELECIVLEAEPSVGGEEAEPIFV
jgi:hypothetical protein